MKVYKHLLAYARPYRWFVIPFFAFTILAVIFSVFQFALIIPLLNVLFDNNSGKEILSPPTFSVSANFFKDIFYYQVYRLKSVNPVYAPLLHHLCDCMRSAACQPVSIPGTAYLN
jgi:subfamily B ATP-binding cassette protein MsbA